MRVYYMSAYHDCACVVLQEIEKYMMRNAHSPKTGKQLAFKNVSVRVSCMRVSLSIMCVFVWLYAEECTFIQDRHAVGF